MHVIAILADIHANLPILLAVEADLRARGITNVVVAGDLIWRGPMGTAVVQHVQRAGWRCVRGNHEDYVLGCKHWRVPPAWLLTEEWAALRWMGRELSDEAGAFSIGRATATRPLLRAVRRYCHRNRSRSSTRFLTPAAFSLRRLGLQSQVAQQ